ncbi:MATE family efflux transporter [Ancylobacter oerskovii]|uniref:MATE family efflux transporter n=1 Tax=Ancylobacter oerskovii TaxID=459519 RepID=A0ABW4Z5W9_9HYPH|nr:MATE family efflux transporter [Ancylobacter oerskovii]MBS7546428.1 MATE family efflux transporter [Ancylobacter oerskovii]
MIDATIETAAPAQGVDGRTRRLLEAPILPLLVALAWPNVLIMLAQASTGLIETWWVAKLGTDALAAMALVYPAFMLMTAISAGAVGGGISSAIARALGRSDRERADALVLHALVVCLLFGFGFAAIFLLFGETIYRFLGGKGAELDGALTYSNILFSGIIFVWLMNGLASIIRGTGNMFFPAAAICVGVVCLVPLSPVLIFGLGPLPALGIAGGALALILYFAALSLVMAWHIASGRNPVRIRWTGLRRAPFADILRVGALSAFNGLQTNIVIAGATALVATAGPDAVAGFGTGVRLEYLLIPLVFGIGAPVVAMVGTNHGAGRHHRALRIALTGAALSFGVAEAVGLAAAAFPHAWLTLFSAEPGMVEVGSLYLRIVGPFYGFFGLGMALYFASQGFGRMCWSVTSGVMRVVVALGGGYLALPLTGSLAALFGALALGLVTYGLTIVIALRRGAWLK